MATLFATASEVETAQVAFALGIFCAIGSAVYYIQKKKVEQRYDADRPESRTEFGRQIVEERRSLIQSGFEDIPIRLALLACGACLIVSLASFILNLVTS